MKIKTFLMLGALALSGTAGAAGLWAGAEATTTGFGVHAGASLLQIPLLGALGLEGAAEKGWDDSANQNHPNRYAAGLTLRDLNLPLSKVDAFATLGAEYTDATHFFAEGGLRGPLLGPAGWRAFVRGNSAKQFSGGLGLELRF